MRKLLAATILTMTLFACGDDDSGGDASDAGETSEDPAGATTAPDASGTDDTTDVTVEGDGGGFSGEGSAEFCDFAAEVDDVQTDDLERLGEIYDDAIDRAPEEIRGDFERLRDAFSEYVAALEELGIDDNNLSSVTDPEQLAQLADLFSDPEIAEATERVGTYITEVCGLE